MTQLQITVVLGTARVERYSEKVSRKILSMLETYPDLDVTFVDVRDFAFTYTIPSWEESEKAKPWRDIVRKTDGFLFIFPEYNRGIPGEFKQLLDSEAPRNYSKRALGLIGVSSGDFGAARAITSIQPIVSQLGLVHSNRPLHVQNVQELFDESHDIVADKRNKFEEFARITLEELLWLTRALKNAREETN